MCLELYGVETNILGEIGWFASANQSTITNVSYDS